MSDNWTWQPVEEPIGPVELEIEYYTHGDSDTATHYDAGHLGGDWVSLGGDIVTTINWGAHEDYRLCRRVPATGAPVDAIRWLVDRFGEDDPLLPYSPAGRALIQSIRDWLNITMQGREWEALCEYMAANAPEPEPYDGYPDDYPEPSEDWDDEGDWD